MYLFSVLRQLHPRILCPIAAAPPVFFTQRLPLREHPPPAQPLRVVLKRLLRWNQGFWPANKGVRGWWRARRGWDRTGGGKT